MWFTNHPQLRYGGYSISFLVLSIPLALLFQNFENKKFFEKKFKFLVILIIVLFNVKNIDRINKEIQRTDHYSYDNFPFFAIPKKEYIFEKTTSGLVVYKTKGHCWNTPSPCVQSLGEFNFTITKKNGFFFINNKKK